MEISGENDKKSSGVLREPEITANRTEEEKVGGKEPEVGSMGEERAKREAFDET